MFHSLQFHTLGKLRETGRRIRSGFFETCVHLLNNISWGWAVRLRFVWISGSGHYYTLKNSHSWTGLSFMGWGRRRCQCTIWSVVNTCVLEWVKHDGDLSMVPKFFGLVQDLPRFPEGSGFLGKVGWCDWFILDQKKSELGTNVWVHICTYVYVYIYIYMYIHMYKRIQYTMHRVSYM